MIALAKRRVRPLTLVVLAVAAATTYAGVSPSRAASLPGRYTGLSSQRLPIALTIADDGVTLSVDVSWISEHGIAIERSARPRATRIDAGGAFSWAEDRTEHGSDGDELRTRLRLDGRLQPDGTIAGTWRADLDAADGQNGPSPPSTSGDVTFSLSIGGSLSQPSPQTDAAGRLVVFLDGSVRSVAVGPSGPWVLTGPPQFGDPPRNQTSVTEIDRRTGAVRGPTPVNGLDGFPVFGAGADAAYVVGTFPARDAPQLARVQAGSHRITRGPRRSRLTPRPSSISALAVGAGGVWMGDITRILRADLRSGRIVRSIALPPDPRARGRRCTKEVRPDLLTTGSGAAWFTSTTVHRCPVGRPHTDVRQRIYHTLWRIDPRTNRPVRALALPGPYAALAAGPSGVWALACSAATQSCGSYSPGARKLLRLGPRGNRPATVARLPAGEVVGLAVGRDAAWVSQKPAVGSGLGGVLRRIDAATGRLTTALALQGTPSNVAADDVGAWVLDTRERTLTHAPQ